MAVVTLITVKAFEVENEKPFLVRVEVQLHDDRQRGARGEKCAENSPLISPESREHSFCPGEHLTHTFACERILTSRTCLLGCQKCSGNRSRSRK